MDSQTWQPLGIALALGLLVGLQRERAKAAAGIRTFPLIAILGAVCAMLAEHYGGWIVGGGLAGLAGVLVALNLGERDERLRPGPTTEIAALLMFGVGAMLVRGQAAVAIAVAGGMAMLLQWKRPLHHFVERIGEDEVRAAFRLVLVAMVVLPVLPDQNYGPYDVLNPFRIWLMVVLIVGISLGGYVASRYVGARAGSLLAGVLGGMISSTATTATYARRSRQSPASDALAAVVILVATTVVFVRVVIEVAVVAPSILPQILPQIAVMTAFSGCVASVAYRRAPRTAVEGEAGPPAGLAAAVIFGLLYALVLLAVAAADARFGDAGLYVVAVLSGLTDVDAITLSTTQLMDSGRVPIDTGWRMVIVGALSNILFKAGVVAAFGSRGLMIQVGALFGAILAGGMALLWLWP